MDDAEYDRKAREFFDFIVFLEERDVRSNIAVDVKAPEPHTAATEMQMLLQRVAQLEHRVTELESRPVVVNNHHTTTADTKTIAKQVEQELGKSLRRSGNYTNTSEA